MITGIDYQTMPIGYERLRYRMSSFEEDIKTIKKENTEMLALGLLRSDRIYNEVKDLSTKKLREWCIEYAMKHEDHIGEVFYWEMEDDMAIDWEEVKNKL